MDEADPYELTNRVLSLVLEGDLASACLELYLCKQQNISAWIKAKDLLFSKATNHRQFFMVSTLVQSSTKQCLSASVHEIPGLLNIVIRNKLC